MEKPATTTFIHLGLPKTATTSIQANLFAEHSQIHYFGKYVGGGFPPTVRELILSKHVRLLERDPGDIHMADIPTQLAYAAEQNLVPVLSKEGFAAGRPRTKRKQAKQFVKNFGNCKAILMVREPVSFIKSYYVQMLKAFQKRRDYKRADWMKRLGTPPRYFDINEWMSIAWPAINSPKRLLRYAETAAVYARTLGEENVRIFIFEEFVRDSKQFITDLCNTIGIDPKEGFDLINKKHENERVTTDYVNRLQEVEQSKMLSEQFLAASPGKRRKMLQPSGQSGDKFRPELSDKWLKKINALGDRQNRRLAKDWNLPLADFGYRL